MKFLQLISYIFPRKSFKQKTKLHSLLEQIKGARLSKIVYDDVMTIFYLVDREMELNSMAFHSMPSCLNYHVDQLTIAAATLACAQRLRVPAVDISSQQPDRVGTADFLLPPDSTDIAYYSACNDARVLDI